MTPVSNSQARVLKLLNLPVPSEYAAAAKALEAVYVRPDGIPAGGNWRTAKKMSDAELLKAVNMKPFFAAKAEEGFGRNEYAM